MSLTPSSKIVLLENKIQRFFEEPITMIHPLWLRIHLFKLREKAGFWVSTHFFSFHLWGGDSIAKIRSESFYAAKNITSLLQNRYKKLQSHQRSLPKTLKKGEMKHYMSIHSEWNSIGPEDQFRIIVYAFQHIEEHLTKPIFFHLIDLLKNNVYQARLENQIAGLFLLNDIIAKYKISSTLRKKIVNALTKIAGNLVEYRVRALALEGLQLLGFNYFWQKLTTTIVHIYKEFKDKILGLPWDMNY